MDTSKIMPSSPLYQEKLNGLVDSIQRLNPTEYEELFKLLYRNKCEYTQNNNGVFLNLSWLSEEMLDKLDIFVKFCHASRKEVQHYEEICQHLSTVVSGKTETDTQEDGLAQKNGTGTSGVIKKSIQPKASSTMKFYLLKKKYAKNGGFDITLQNDLEKEAYVL